MKPFKRKQNADIEKDRRTLTVTATRADRVKIMFSFSAPVKMILQKTPAGIAAEFTSKMFPKKKFVGITVDAFTDETAGTPDADRPLPGINDLPTYKPGKGTK